jgi:hypothetical protein
MKAVNRLKVMDQRQSGGGNLDTIGTWIVTMTVLHANDVRI